MGGVEWMRLAYGWDRGRAFMKTVMSLGVPWGAVIS